MATTLAHSQIAFEETATYEPRFATFYEGITWGTSGALYSISPMGKMLKHVPQAHYHLLRHEGTLAGLRFVLPKSILIAEKTIPAFYHGLAALDPAWQGQGLGRRFAAWTRDRLQNALRGRGLLYCFIEADNDRSQRIVRQLGYEPITHFYALSYSRLSPQAVSCEPGRPSDRPALLDALQKQYVGHTFKDFESSLHLDAYWLTRDEDLPVAGFQSEEGHWRIHSLGGFGGNLAVRLLPKVPLFRKLFNPNDFRFLKVSQALVPQERPERFFRLLDAVLARHGLCTAMLFLDKRSPVYQRLDHGGRWGLLNALTETRVDIYAYMLGLTDREKTDLRQNPAVISPIDL